MPRPSPQSKSRWDALSMSPKRACDVCILRKVKCSGSWPCDTCRDAAKHVSCTYLRPARKRGPKGRTPRQQEPQRESLGEDAHGDDHLELDGPPSPSQAGTTRSISKDVLVPILRLYQQHSYGVWPVVNADVLLGVLDDIDPDNTSHEDENLACLITALCAATMAQLHLAPVTDGSAMVDSTTLAQACLRIQGNCGTHREHLDVSSVLTSFFLHVYHAKVNQRTSAMMYIQEAISGARILRLDEPLSRLSSNASQNGNLIANMQLIFPLLWVSERGYALHLGLSPSYIDSPLLESLEDSPEADAHAQGLLDLVNLFIAFDQISIGRKCHRGRSVFDLTGTEMKLSSMHLELTDCISTRTADCHITRQWMRIILWQEALTGGLLSSSSDSLVMTFGFPAQVCHDLLLSLRHISETDLLPLGRDQLLKCWEVANSLGDVLLASNQSQPRFEFGPQDFLHALYQKLLPFLEQDPALKFVLQAKTAEVLVMAPARLLTEVSPDWSLARDSDERVGDWTQVSAMHLHLVPSSNL
ncbi:hypothetical protein N7492_005708 [Penicillium capsulatum]|uniref:Zn(2)-C6 fungal-type domain-containing protein n=1 Tax=Penicillium capsulatum TaxID=69766 RepID=A0A9W9IA54_9EURO|nr:hypothetical protein N7492_005708 [Penicillium capsulatum]